MKILEAAVDACLILLLIHYVRDRHMLDDLSPAMKTAALMGILFVAYMTLNISWAAANRAWARRLPDQQNDQQGHR